MTNIHQHQIRASYDDRTLSVYQAYGASIAEPALKAKRLVAPISFDRMTWIKPSFLWLMYRSDWARSAGQERILDIRIKRKDWEAALREAVLTTPESHVYKDAGAWRKKLDRARVRVQWDPERSLKNERLAYRSIQVGITKLLIKEYAGAWITDIDDKTSLVRDVHRLVMLGRYGEAEALLPREKEYPTPADIRKTLGME